MFVNHTDVRMARTKIRGGLNLVYNLYEMDHSFSIQISEKPVAPPLDIPSRHPNQIGACSLRSVVMTTVETAHFLKNWTENQNAGFKMDQAKEEQEKRQQFCELYILFYILIECAL